MSENWKNYFKNDKFAAHTGIELIEVCPGSAKAQLEIAAHHLNALNIVQGGAIFTLADFTFAAASNSYGQQAVAVQVSISFLQATSSGTLIAEAREVSRSRKIGNYQVLVFAEDGSKVAVFNGVAYIKKQEIEI